MLTALPKTQETTIGERKQIYSKSALKKMDVSTSGGFRAQRTFMKWKKGLYRETMGRKSMSWTGS
jgi:hypothetical protein